MADGIENRIPGAIRSLSDISNFKPQQRASKIVHSQHLTVV